MNTALQIEADSIKFATESRLEGIDAMVSAAENVIRAAHGIKDPDALLPDEARRLVAAAHTRTYEVMGAIADACDYAKRVDQEGVPLAVTVPSDEDEEC